MQLVAAGDPWVKGAVLIQNIDKTAAHFNKVKPEVGISLMWGSDLREMEECLVSPWLHEPVWRCFRVSDPGTFQSLNFFHYSTPDPCKGATVSREIWFLILGWQTVVCLEVWQLEPGFERDCVSRWVQQPEQD